MDLSNQPLYHPVCYPSLGIEYDLASTLSERAYRGGYLWESVPIPFIGIDYHPNSSRSTIISFPGDVEFTFGRRFNHVTCIYITNRYRFKNLMASYPLMSDDAEFPRSYVSLAQCSSSSPRL